MDDKIWLKRVLIPLWVIQLLISAIFAVISALALYAVEASNMNNRLGQVGQEVENAVKYVQSGKLHQFKEKLTSSVKHWRRCLSSHLGLDDRHGHSRDHPSRDS